MEKTKKSWVKFILAFLGGAVIIAVVLLSTSGELFKGSVLRTPSADQGVTINPDIPVSAEISTETFSVYQQKRISDLEKQVADLQAAVQSINTKNNTQDTAIQNILTFAQAKYAILDPLKADFDAHTHTLMVNCGSSSSGRGCDTAYTSTPVQP